MKRRLVITLIIFFSIQSSYAQSSLTLPEQNANEAKEKYVLLSDFYNSENYMGAYESLLWIMDHAPDMHESVYVIGIKSVKKIIEENPTNMEYKNKLMEVYDMRMHYFGNEEKVLARKAFDAYLLFRDDSNYLLELGDMFNKLFAMENSAMEENLYYPYFDIKASQLEQKIISDQELINSYQMISDIIQQKSGDEEMTKVQNLIDNRLAQVLTIDCGSLGKLFENNSNDQELNLQQAKLIIKLSIAYGCKEDPIFLLAIKELFKADPTIKLAKLIASYHMEKDEFIEAKHYYEEALKFANNDEKSILYYDLANTYFISGDKINARKMAYNSLKYNQENSECYRLIGDLYYNSFDECKKGLSRVEDRSVFYAAFEKYQEAGNKTKMILAEQQFPTMEEIHMENFAESQTINTNCWIGEPIKIRRRPNLTSN